MSKKPIKSSLFRFVTLRSPQAIDDKETKFGLVLPSEQVKGSDSVTPESAYYQAVQGITDNAARESALTDLSFSAIETKTELKNSYAELYKFSSWLMRNKNYLTYKSVASNLPSSFLLDDTNVEFVDLVLSFADEAEVWDNLIYQTISRTSTSLREGLIQVLIANKFLKEFSWLQQELVGDLGEGEIVDYEANEEKFQKIGFDKLANASVVIEKEVLYSNKLDQVTAASPMSETAMRFMKDRLEIAMSKQRVADYQEALKELEKEEVLFNKLNQEDYESKLKTHQDAVIAEFARVETVDAGTGEKTYPGLALPDFDYTPLTPDFKNIGGEFYSKSSEDPSDVMSQKTLNILQKSEFEVFQDFSSLKSQLKSKISDELAVLAKAPANTKKQTSLGGSEVSIDPFELLNLDPYCFTGNLRRERLANGESEFSISLIIATDRNNPYIVNGEGSVSNPGGTNTTLIPGGSVTNNDGKLVSYTFPLPNDTFDEDGDWNFQATLEFSNGDIINIDISISYSTAYSPRWNPRFFLFTGCGVLDNGGTGDPDPNDPDPDPNNSVTPPTFYGVTNLGIADFRRVEQTICCYVPGEVSHVENILASEYKEKSTRSFVSTEITSEQTRETEVENLSDTTSTERNEMSSEASTVIDEQRSKDRQANASVSGKKFGVSFSAGFSANNSASTSTSNSTSQAQNYAQEVTERALERVVKKISSKRTSRVLREYEENNKHGFDNTKGKNHITGIYRWIDKIYENQIVNYGKRLTYEFAIPEPARFLKEALFTGDDYETTDLGLIAPTKPVHPTKIPNLDIKGASDISEVNYQIIANEYNAIVSAPLDEYVRVGKTFTKEAESYDASGQAAEIDLPSNYVAVSGDIIWSVVARESQDTYMSIKLGDARHRLVGLNDNVPTFYNFTDGYIGSIPFGLYFNLVHSGTFSVTVKCKRSQEAYKTWQDETYNAILDAYQDRLQEYNDFQLSQQDITAGGSGERLKFNPDFNRKMEARELKKYAIQLLTESTNIVISKDNFADSSGMAAIKADSAFGKHTEVVKFFEQAFDWELMAYQLYPYYYSSKNKWEALVTQKEDGDPIFQAFLQSGMARMVVPVRKGFETAINWYQATGEVWNGEGLVTDINDDLYLSIVEEMLEPEGVPVGEPWNTQVPTSLTIVQARSAELLQGGLPCNTECGEVSQFGDTTLVISGADGSNAADGVGADIVGTDNDVA